MKIYNLFCHCGDGCTFSCEHFIASFTKRELAEDLILKIIIFLQVYKELVTDKSSYKIIDNKIIYNKLYANDMINLAKEYGLELEFVGKKGIDQELKYYEDDIENNFKIKDSIFCREIPIISTEDDFFIKETELYE